MAETKKTTKTTKPISDVEEPGKSAASATSKPVIVTNRPLIKDPMVVEEEQKDAVEPVATTKKTSTKPKLQPLESSPKPEEETQTNSAEDTADNGPEKKPTKNKSAEDDEKAEAQRKLERESNLQKIVDAKTYYLPINAVEKRKTKRFVILGVLLSILLIMVWINIALDAELVQIDGITPVTNLF